VTHESISEAVAQAAQGGSGNPILADKVRLDHTLSKLI